MLLKLREDAKQALRLYEEADDIIFDLKVLGYTNVLRVEITVTANTKEGSAEEKEATGLCIKPMREEEMDLAKELIEVLKLHKRKRLQKISATLSSMGFQRLKEE